MRCTWFWALGFVPLVACGGGTALGGLPRPNTVAVAGIAAAVATAATIADPGAAGRSPEEGKVRSLEGVKGDGETIPLDVLDRLDAADAAAAADSDSSATQP